MTTNRGQVLRFLVVGGLSLAVDFTTYVLLYHLRVPAALAAAGGYIVAFTVNFSLNRTWVFGASATTRRQIVRYATLVVVNLIITAVAVGWLVDEVRVEYRLAKLIVAAVIAAANFVLMRMWVFRSAATKPGPPEPSA